MIPPKPITVLLAEDHKIVREGLRMLLEVSGEFHVVAEATSGREAVALARKFLPDVVVMDIAMPQLNGFEATRQVLAVSPRTRVLALSAHSDDEYVQQIIRLGASGYLAKQNSGQVLVHAIKEIVKGKSYFSASLLKRIKANELRAKATKLGAEPTAPLSLTSREAEVLQLVAEGSPNKKIAVELHISVKTVQKHRQQLMDKLGIHDTAGLTRYAISTGSIESS